MCVTGPGGPGGLAILVFGAHLGSFRGLDINPPRGRGIVPSLGKQPAVMISDSTRGAASWWSTDVQNVHHTYHTTLVLT